MRYLPALASGAARWVLPMAGRSADLLTEAAVAGPSTGHTARLARQLALDPPLALWAVCSAERRGDKPRTLGALADWLATHALAALGCQGPTDPPDRFAELVAASVLAAELYHARPPGLDTTAGEGFLRALLHNAPAWLAATNLEFGSRNSELGLPTSEFRIPTSEFLPQWLAAQPDPPAGAAEPPIDPEPCRRRAEQARAAWLSPGLFSDKLLSPLAAKLARLAELEDHFAEALQREKLQAMAEFAAGAGHEINNPLAVIAGRAQLFSRDEKDPERRRGLALINAQAMRVYEMIADMRLFARPPEPERKRVEMVGLVDRVIEELTARAAEQDTSLLRTGEPGPLALEADPTQLAVALKALVTNAFEALGGGGHVTIDLGRGQGEIRIRVWDDGPGIAPQDLGQIFDPFFSARQAGRGLGMGLAKCWRIVTNHGGRIDVESRPGHGATFTIRFQAMTNDEARMTKQ